ncbi:TraE/TraK family type IV conjugative transfer system protein [Halomonas sp. I5-271120]|uniref:TraE/TraK family type IV conjugative transfer system protein n=1 Tax=Halomonas sp. I5-271120 TaxID=3061632 RepID=UPI0027148501|nr:TraE/TraK family type IV conjugative transfer system protein [Halomonas sp. I5-271120]
MKVNQFKKSLTQTNGERKFLGGVVGILAVAVLILAYLLTADDSKVIIQPYTLSEEAWITQEKASVEYQESMALFFSELLGNVTPATVGFIKERIDPLLGANIRQKVVNTLADQAETIKTEQVVITFNPRSIIYEKPTGKVFVTGRSKTEGPSGAVREEQRTFEFEFQIANYLPRLTALDNYEGKAITQELIEQRAKLQKASEEREQS